MNQRGLIDWIKGSKESVFVLLIKFFIFHSLTNLIVGLEVKHASSASRTATINIIIIVYDVQTKHHVV